MEPYFAFALYFFCLLTLGLLTKRSMQTDKAFVMGNRGLNYYVTALSAHSSDMSAWLFMGLPGLVFLEGLGGAWIALGLIVGMWVNWKWIAPRLRRKTEQFDACTLSTFFERRYADKSGVIRLLSGFLALIFLLAYLTAGIVAMGHLIEALFSVPYYLGILVMMPIMVLYVYMGGYTTVAWVDFFQGLFLFFVIVFVPLLVWTTLGGFTLIEHGASLRGVTLAFWDADSYKNNFCQLLLGLGWGLGYLGQPHILNKFMGIRDVKELSKSMWIGMTWQILALSSAVMVGLVAFGFFGDAEVYHELIFVEMVKYLFSPFFAAFILCAVVAANMSTMDSQLLVASSVVAEDIFRKISKKSLNSQVLLRLSRVSVVGISLFATLFALAFHEEGVLVIVNYAWSGLGATFGPLVIASLYATRVNKYGVICGILVGGVTAALWPMFAGELMTEYCIMPILPGFCLSWLAMFGVSSLTKEVLEK